MATRTEPPEPATAADPARATHRRRIRIGAVTLYLAVFVAYWVTLGLPTDPVLIFLFLWVGIAAWNAAAPWRDHLRFARDWIPLVIVIVAYNFSRGAADNLGVPVHVTEPIHADEWLTGWFTGGQIPTVWLQQHLYTPGHVHWYDVVGAFVYFSHFVTAMTVAAVLWLRGRGWAAFMWRFITLDAIGLAIYVLYPMAPPWWAAQRGLLPPAPRITDRGWGAIGLHSAGRLITKGQGVANPVAAMPSLHAAFALFIALFFILRIRKLWTLLLLLYPLAMAWTLIYFSEHYLIDILVGWALSLVVFALVGPAERWWVHRHRPGGDPAADPPARRAAVDIPV
ncbi:MAG: phosphatase PAP2 family protein [Actinomycetota bacterium]|nr:phosphatase PAP2 family protein [Actinomycetota bacterium]